MLMNKKRIFVAGHRGMVGSAIVRQLNRQNDVELILRSHQELDLTSQAAVQTFFMHEHIDEVYLAAAKVGGIHANNAYPAEFIYENLVMECNIIHAAHQSRSSKTAVFGVFLYLSEASYTANDGSSLADRYFGTDERALCYCYDCRDQIM